MSEEPTGWSHRPVMVAEILEIFATVPAGIVIDATVGGAGHAVALLEARDDIAVMGLDRDPVAVAAARRELARFGTRAEVHKTRFDEMEAEEVSGVLFDLGVSSPQLDVARRGFSYRHHGPIDMRMDPDQGLTAGDVVNHYDVDALAGVLRRYGDERHAGRIARAIVASRPHSDTVALAEIIAAAVPAPGRRRGGHPARRSFQALRIEVNRELEVLDPALDKAVNVLVPGGRCAVLSYHSGEDRIVKRAFTMAVTGGCECPAVLGCGCGARARARARWVFRGSHRPGTTEQALNRRATSARLRAVEAVALPSSTVEEVGS